MNFKPNSIYLRIPSAMLAVSLLKYVGVIFNPNNGLDINILHLLSVLFIGCVVAESIQRLFGALITGISVLVTTIKISRDVNKKFKSISSLDLTPQKRVSE